MDQPGECNKKLAKNCTMRSFKTCIEVTKSVRMKLAGHVARMGYKRRKCMRGLSGKTCRNELGIPVLIWENF